MKRRLWLLMLFLFAGHVPAASADSACEGRFVNPITDICWSCIFPLSLGSIKVSQGKASSVKMAAPDMDIVIRWANKIQQAAREVRNMPVTEETFNNYLKSQMRGEWRDVLTRGIRDELVRRGVMKIQGNKIIW